MINNFQFFSPRLIRLGRTIFNFQKKNSQLTTHNSQLNSGFTLLELLVVISIIAILVTLSISSFTTAQKKSRDSKRKADIRGVQTSLEQYYAVCGYTYPTPAGSFFVSVNCPTPPISIMPTVPTDPRQTTPYYCGPTPGAENCIPTSYTICSVLESETPNSFCVSNQQ